MSNEQGDDTDSDLGDANEICCDIDDQGAATGAGHMVVIISPTVRDITSRTLFGDDGARRETLYRENRGVVTVFRVFMVCSGLACVSGLLFIADLKVKWTVFILNLLITGYLHFMIGVEKRWLNKKGPLKFAPVVVLETVCLLVQVTCDKKSMLTITLTGALLAVFIVYFLVLTLRGWSVKAVKTWVPEYHLYLLPGS